MYFVRKNITKKENYYNIYYSIKANDFNGVIIDSEIYYEVRTVKEWFAYYNQMFSSFFKTYQKLSYFKEQNAPAFYALGECASGTLAQVLLVWDMCDLFFAKCDEWGIKTSEQKYIYDCLKEGNCIKNNKANDYLVVVKRYTKTYLGL